MKPDAFAPPPDFLGMVERATAWTGWTLTDRGRAQLARLGEWLATEAIPAGGLGPHEGGRIHPRHLVDSLLFAVAWRKSEPPETVVDLGSGVGLPGIPLALVWPASRTVLVEVSGRRADLARRAVRVLGLDNVEVRQVDAATGSPQPTADLVVARAAAPVESVREWAGRWVNPDGCIVIGGSHHRRPVPGPTEEIVAVPEDVLDRPVWLRKIAPA